MTPDLATRSLMAPATTRDYLSYSAISTFQSCPLRYYFRYVLGLPEELVSGSLVFGSAMHASVQFHFEQLLAGNPAPDLDAILDVFQDYWQRYEGQVIQFPKDEDYNGLCHLADRMLRAFQKSAFAHPQGVILGVEEELRGELIPGLPDLLGRVDLIVDAGPELVLSDFKTSRRTWSQDQILDAAPQLLLYSHLAGDLSDGKPFRLEFAVLTKTKFPDLSVHAVSHDAHAINRTKTIVERVWRAIEAGNFYPNPSPLNCPTCPFQGACQAWTG